jgi:hypothetical protein
MMLTFSRIIDLMRAFSLLSAAALAIDFLRHPSAATYLTKRFYIGRRSRRTRNDLFRIFRHCTFLIRRQSFFSLYLRTARIPAFFHTSKVGDVISRSWWHFIPLEPAKVLP